MSSNVVDLASWATPSARLTELCDQAIAMFSTSTANEAQHSIEFASLAEELDAVIVEIKRLPPLPGELGRSVKVLLHTKDHPQEQVLRALQTMRRLSAIAATPALSPTKRTTPKKERNYAKTPTNPQTPNLPGFEP